MVNQFRVRKYLALFLTGIFPVISFVLGDVFYKNFWISLGMMLFTLIVMVIVGILLLSNPFSKMLEGAGILVFNLDSTGIIKPFLVKVQQPFIYGKLFGKQIKDVFNRQTVYNLTPPIEGANYKKDDSGIHIDLDEKEYNKSRFALFHFPVLIYNQQVKSVITKDMLSDTEKNLFTEHTVLYLTRLVEDLSSQVRDFARYAVETLKPKESIFQNKWFWIVAVILIGGLLLALAPKIIATIQGATSTAGTAMSGATIQPR